VFTDEQVEAAVRALSDPAHRSQVRSALAEADEIARAERIETLLAEETRMGMLVGVAVGWELARELDSEGDDSQGD
jgi:hypothetical protein